MEADSGKKVVDISTVGCCFMLSGLMVSWSDYNLKKGRGRGSVATALVTLLFYYVLIVLQCSSKMENIPKAMFFFQKVFVHLRKKMVVFKINSYLHSLLFHDHRHIALFLSPGSSFF